MSATDRDPLLDGLTEPQRQAVLHTEGPVLILAAAGSGKTRTLTRRIGHLIRLGVPPWSILALTFTNKAAAEMRERVMHLLGGDQADPRQTRGLTLTTFHSLCARLLRRYAELAQRSGATLGITPDYTIYDSADQAAMMKRVLEGLQMSSTNWPPRSVLGAISAAKNELLDAEAFAAQATDFYAKNIAKAYTAYERALRAASAVDFDDLLLLTARMLRQSEPVRQECRARWQYLLVDEYQDTNKAQFMIAALLAGAGEVAAAAPGAVPGAAPARPNICVVGDPDQSIYGWRGADISNILDFEQQFPGCRVITLGENFRSTAPILAVADTLIKHNARRKDKPLFTRRPGGEPVEAVLCRDEQHEASLVVDWLRARHEGLDAGQGQAAPVPWRSMAALYRNNALSRVMEESLRAAGVPYVIARGTAFYEREEVKNALAYLRVVANPADDVSLARILNTPTRGIGDTTQTQLELLAARQGLTLMDALRQVAEGPAPDGLSSRAQPAIARFVQLVDGWTGRGSFWASADGGATGEAGHSLATLVEKVVKESGLEKMYAAQAKASQSDADADRLDNLAELISSARQFELEYDPSSDPALDPRGTGVPTVDESGASVPPALPPLLSMLRAYLESVALVADADAVDPEQGAVTLMTLHAAKGLEFEAVAMIGLDEGLLPSSRARESEAALEEERRLCFVGITRAMRRLLVTSSKYRTMRGLSERQIPSRFLDEIGKEHARFSDQSDPLGGLDERWTGEHDEADRDAALRRGVPPSLLRGLHREADAALADRGRRLGVAAKFPVGATVRHPQFGVGRILSVQGGANARAQIQFRDVGVKTLVLEYARLERVGG